jgi:hypothetical protein
LRAERDLRRDKEQEEERDRRPALLRRQAG